MAPNNNVTFRLRGIPGQYSRKKTVEELIGKALSIDQKTGFTVHSLATNPLEPESSTATISFKDKPTHLSDRSKIEWSFGPQGEWYSDDIDGRRNPLVFDTHFSGFTPLQSSKQEDCKVDLIALSGLGGHAFGSFKQKNGPFMWLRDALPHHIPTARILIYGYDTTTVQSSSFQNLEDLGRALQTDIRDLRVKSKVGKCGESKLTFDWNSTPNRPIIFIGHSLGGLVIKQAIAKMAEDKHEEDMSALHSVAAFLFFGVPHHGMSIGSLVPLVGDHPNRALLESLGKNSPVLRRLQREFEKAFDTKIPSVISYFETLTSHTAIEKDGKWEMDGPPETLVDPASATLGSKDRNPVQRNHSELVKYTCAYDQVYMRVQRTLSRLIGPVCRVPVSESRVEERDDESLTPRPAPQTLFQERISRDAQCTNQEQPEQIPVKQSEHDGSVWEFDLSRQDYYYWDGFQGCFTYSSGNRVYPDQSAVTEHHVTNPAAEFSVKSGPSYKRRNASFYNVGRIFELQWPKVEKNSPDTRVFVVVRQGEDCCTCLPIETYDGLGVSKRGVNKAEHSPVFFTQSCTFYRWEDPHGEMLIPIRICLTEQGGQLSSMARINYAEAYTVEHNVDANDFGYVMEDYIPTFRHQFLQILSSK